MRCQHAVSAILLLLIGLLATAPGFQPAARAQGKPEKSRLEYKVMVCPVDLLSMRIAKKDESGEIREIGSGPAESAAAMTRQFNELAADGWEYVGPITVTQGLPPTSGAASAAF